MAVIVISTIVPYFVVSLRLGGNCKELVDEDCILSNSAFYFFSLLPRRELILASFIRKLNKCCWFERFRPRSSVSPFCFRARTPSGMAIKTTGFRTGITRPLPQAHPRLLRKKLITRLLLQGQLFRLVLSESLKKKISAAESWSLLSFRTMRQQTRTRSHTISHWDWAAPWLQFWSSTFWRPSPPAFCAPTPRCRGLLFLVL